MSTRRFWPALRNTPRDWFLTPSGAIVREVRPRELACSITAACKQETGKFFATSRYRDAGKLLGMTLAEMVMIATANDTLAFGLDAKQRQIRRRLLDACGLTERR